ncbi:hypothetical protein OURE66S_02285 [Oligella ureolytica]
MLSSGEAIHERYEWIPSLDLAFAFRMDGLSYIFALIVSGMGALISLYARYYMDPADPRARFYAYFLIFMGSMLGLVLSGNVIQMVIFWELTEYGFLSVDRLLVSSSRCPSRRQNVFNHHRYGWFCTISFRIDYGLVMSLYWQLLLLLFMLIFKTIQTTASKSFKILWIRRAMS